MKGKPRKYLFHLMEVGQHSDYPWTRNRLAAKAAHQYKRRNPGWDYSARRIDWTIRIWRNAYPPQPRFGGVFLCPEPGNTKHPDFFAL